MKEYSLWILALKKGENQRILRLLYHNPNPEKKFPVKLVFTWSIFASFSNGEKGKTIWLKVYEIMAFKNWLQGATKRYSETSEYVEFNGHI